MFFPLLISSFLLDAGSQQPAEFQPSKFQKDGWVTRCWKGTDGFAVDCEARRSMRGFVVRIAVSDAQLVQSIEHAACRPSQEAHRFSVFRDSLFASSERSRQRLMRANFLRIARLMARRCPGLPALRGSDLRQIPDVAMAKEGDLR